MPRLVFANPELWRRQIANKDRRLKNERSAISIPANGATVECSKLVGLLYGIGAAFTFARPTHGAVYTMNQSDGPG